MANTSSFSFTNTTASTHNVTPVEIGEKTNYSAIADEPTRHVRQNTTAALDQGELLTVTSTPVRKVTCSLPLVYPLGSKQGVQYMVKLDEVLRTVDGAGNIVCDEPIVAYLVIRHQITPNITTSIVETVVKRLLGACYKSDGTSRFGDWMRSALEPISD